MQDLDGPDDAAPAWWQQQRVALGAAAAIVLLAAACAWLAIRLDIAEDRRLLLERQAEQGFLRPPSSSRTVRANLESPATVALGGGDLPERVELRIAARGNRFNVFRVAIARDDGTEVIQVDRLQRDTNGELRLALNTSLLPKGSYSLRVEGFTWRGETVPAGRIALRR
ncbi:MAG: hypothetical protein MUC71_10810 [Steroidobacteraceae bacterium]|nr:hypothetical protein [Steroidobacteraceae bacterium]